MAENTLEAGIRVNNMEKAYMSMLRVRRNMANGNMARELDGLTTDKICLFCFEFYVFKRHLMTHLTGRLGGDLNS